MKITAEDIPDVVCSVCHTQLDVATQYHRGVLVDYQFNHAAAADALGVNDHEPQPMLADENTPRAGVCDFCTGLDPVWRYPTKSFNVIYEVQDSTSVGDWAACDACHDLIEAERWKDLCHRCLTHSPLSQREFGNVSASVMFQLRKNVLGLHKRFAENRLGPAIREHS